MTNQPFPNLNSRVVDPAGNLTTIWRQFFQTLWTRTGGVPGSQFAALNGSSSEVFNAANAITGTEVTTLSQLNAAVSSLAPLASPVFTGTPEAPTAAALTDNTQIATTAYADGAVAVEKSRAEAAEALLLPIPDKARLYRNAAFTTTSAAFSLIPFDTVSYDTNSISNASNGFTPKRAGYYQITGHVSVTGVASNGRAIVSIFKNGAESSRGVDISSPAAAGVLGSVASDLIYANGSTDYFNLYAYTSAALSITSGTTMAYFSIIGPF